MKRILRRFVSKLNNTNRIIFIAFVIIFCVISLAIGIYVQFFYKYSDRDPFMIGINIGAKKEQEEYDLLKQKFNELFKNNLNGDSKLDDEIEKIEEDQQIVYTAYNIVNEDENYYSIDAKIPKINLESDVAKQINTSIKQNYYEKAYSIMNKNDGKTIYTVSYTSYINSNVLSLVIKTSLKEENKNEKVTVKTYVYNMVSEKLVNLEDLIDLKEEKKESIQSMITDEIKREYENSQIILEEYGNVYERDLSSDIYKVEKTENYFLTDDGYVYIIYSYGNYDDTNEMDILIF